MRSVLPLSLAVNVLAIGSLIVMQFHLARAVSEIPKSETNRVEIMEPQQICLTKSWCSTACGQVEVKTCFREQGHEGESMQQFVARHNAAIATLMALCPEDC